MGTIVAIDGPAGSGKSSVAREVASRLGFTRVDTGAIYRALTLVALENQVKEADELRQLARELPYRTEGVRVFLGARDVTDEIRSTRVTEAVSNISKVSGVRSELLELQRRLGRSHPRGAVLEGRDIGTVVFPDADVKVFLTATAEERARRRHAELQGSGRTDSYESVLASIQGRDEIDGSRDIAPMQPAEDARHLDTTELTFEKVVDAVVNLVGAEGC